MAAFFLRVAFGNPQKKWGWLRGRRPLPPYTNALKPVIARPTMSELISFVPSYE
jgi:hypothetical protein